MSMHSGDDTLQTSRQSQGFWLMVSLLMMVLAGAAVLASNLDPDCFWHLRVAEQLQHDGIGPLVDQISFASPKEPWAPYSWLGELAMKWAWDLGGLRGAVLWQAALQAAFVWLMALCCLQSSASSKSISRVAAVLTITFATALGMR